MTADPLAIPCDRCGEPCGVDCLAVRHRPDPESAYCEARGTYCGSVCANAAVADGSVAKAWLHPTPGRAAHLLRAQLPLVSRHIGARARTRRYDTRRDE